MFERVEGKKLSVCKVTFGAEPKEYEIQAYILKNYYRLKFSPAVEVSIKKQASNPKKVQREARKQTLVSGIGTRSQQAIQPQQEEMKTQRREKSRAEKKAELQRRFELKQQKRKRKHRGR